MRPGLTTHTHESGEPLPLPILVSAGLDVNGLSGKTRIQILPPLFIYRVMAIRAASICRESSHPHSVACSPNSPNDRVVPRHGLPLIRPFICFLCLTRFGINIE